MHAPTGSDQLSVTIFRLDLSLLLLFAAADLNEVGNLSRKLQCWFGFPNIYLKLASPRLFAGRIDS